MLYPLIWMVASVVQAGRTHLHATVDSADRRSTSRTTRGLDTRCGSASRSSTGTRFLIAGAGGDRQRDLVLADRLRLRAARRSAGKHFWFAMMLGTLMLPYHVTLIPQYVLFLKLGWVDTFLPLVVPKFLAADAFFIFLMVQFFRGIPRELDEAAMMDGCGPWRIYWKIILPLSLPVLATAAIFSFIWTWDDFLGPLIYLNDLRTTPCRSRSGPSSTPPAAVALWPALCHVGAVARADLPLLPRSSSASSSAASRWAPSSGEIDHDPNLRPALSGTPCNRARREPSHEAPQGGVVGSGIGRSTSRATAAPRPLRDRRPVRSRSRPRRGGRRPSASGEGRRASTICWPATSTSSTSAPRSACTTPWRSRRSRPASRRRRKAGRRERWPKSTPRRSREGVRQESSCPIFQYRFGNGLQKLKHLQAARASAAAVDCDRRDTWWRGARLLRGAPGAANGRPSSAAASSRRPSTPTTSLEIHGPVNSVICPRLEPREPDRDRGLAVISLAFANGPSRLLGHARLAAGDLAAALLFRGSRRGKRHRALPPRQGPLDIPRRAGAAGRIAPRSRIPARCPIVRRPVPSHACRADRRRAVAGDARRCPRLLELLTAVYHSAETGRRSRFRYRPTIPSTPAGSRDVAGGRAWLSSLREVVKRYGAVQVIHGVDLDVRDGEFVVFVGPSGCGKSTLLRMIAGLEEISDGEVLSTASGERGARRKARDRDGVPVLRALPAHDACTRTCRSASRPWARRGPRSSACSDAAKMLKINELLGRRPASCPAASGSASRSAAPSSASRRYSCSTSRCRTSTPSSGCRCGSR